MIDWSEVEKSLREFTEGNAYWREDYETAPSENAKKVVALGFYYSDTDDEEAARLMDELEESFTLEDWRHQLKYNGNNPRVAFIRKKIQQLGGE